MRSSTPIPKSTARGSSAATALQEPAAAAVIGQDGSDSGRAVQAPIPPAEPAAANPSSSTDTPAEALGRRTLSTAFVRVGPDGQLTVELRDGRVLVLHAVVMRPRTFCGEQHSGDPYCGGYADVAAARPGGAAIADEPGGAMPTPPEPERGPAKRR